MRKALRNLLAAGFIAACAWAVPAQAGIVVTGTRVIFPANEREVTIKLNNAGAAPALVQAWIDDGDPNASPDKIDVPFVLTPAMFRLDPAKGQTLRLIYTGAPLAQDKETLFWLNVLEIPPKPSAEAGSVNRLQLAFRTRIKVMFRPQGLPGRPDEAPGKVRWELVQTSGGYQLKATNPTPYHVNLGALALVAGGQTLDAGAGYIKPGESAEFPVAGLKGWPKADAQVQYSAINDYGAAVKSQAPVTSAPTP